MTKPRDDRSLRIATVLLRKTDRWVALYAVLRNYLKRKDRQIDRLYTYAKMLRCEAIVRTYLEVLVS